MIERAGIQAEGPLLKHVAAKLRKQQTPAEAYAWELLRGKRFQGLKFRRQHVVEGHIVDFFCHELRLCVELDGEPHQGEAARAKDRERDERLRMRGYQVLRVPNEVVLNRSGVFKQRLEEARSASILNPPL